MAGLYRIDKKKPKDQKKKNTGGGLTRLDKPGKKLNPNRPGFIRTPTDPTKKKGQKVAGKPPKRTATTRPTPGVGPKPIVRPIKRGR